MEHSEQAATHTDVCQYCLEVHALASADENFRDDRGFSIYELSTLADAPVVPLRWETITRETQFAAALAYLTDVAADYLRNGDVECHCGDQAAERDVVDQIIAFENGELELEEVYDLFQRLIDDGTVWHLQGSYGRAAAQLIEAGICHA